MSRGGRIAAAGLLAVVALALAAGFLPHGPTKTRTAHGVEVLRAPSERHWLGTDDRGRDVAARLAYGARTSLVVAAGALVLALVAGAALGAAAAARRGAVDAAVVAACDVVGAIPGLVLVVAAQGLVGRASLLAMIVLIAIPRAADIARIARAEVTRALSLPFVEAARAAGATRTGIVLRHALPHAWPQLAVAAAMTVSVGVLAEASLTFLGFGVPHPTPSWGELLRQAEHAEAWWLSVPAGAAVALVALCASVLADAMAAKPRR